MKKLLGIMVLGLLLSGNAYAGVNEPGVTSIAGCDKSLKYQYKKFVKKHLKKLSKKNVNSVLYASCDYKYNYSWAVNKGKDLEKLHKKTYKQCGLNPVYQRGMKQSKKHTGKECYLYAVNEEIVWKYDKAKASTIAKTKIAEAKALKEKNVKIDKKPGRFFEDQPDVNDDYQIHFNYLLAADSEDREWDINGKMEKIILKMNKVMAKATAKHKKGDGVARKYKFDYRADGKLDITFIRMDKNFKDLHKWANIDIIPFLNNIKGQRNIKKHYYNFADFNNVDGGEAGVGYGTIYLKNNGNGSDKRKMLVTLHELHHSNGGGYNCVPGMSNELSPLDLHYVDQERRVQLTHGRKLGATYAHKLENCPQLQDSVYLTPTSSEPYDPYEVNCLFKIGKYNHPKITKVIEQMKKVKKGTDINWRLRFGSSCRYRDWNRGRGGFYIWGVEKEIISTLK